MNGEFEKRLHEALCNFYDLDELAQMVRFQLNAQLDRITKGGRKDVVVFDLIQWAAPQKRMADLPVHAAEFKKVKVAALEALRAEFEALMAMPAPAKPGPVTALPDELVQLLRTYESIPQLIADGPARLALMEQTAAKIKTVLKAESSLHEALHLSESAGERLTAILALELTPDEKYLRWLAERVVCEPPYVGQAATVALTNAAYGFDRGKLGRVRTMAQAAIDLLAGIPDTGRRKSQLQRAVQIVDRRTGTMTSSQDIPFDDVVSALIDAFQTSDLQSLLKAEMGLALDKIVKMPNRPECVFCDLLITADQAGWDADLVSISAKARPAAKKLQDVSAHYSRIV